MGWGAVRLPEPGRPGPRRGKPPALMPLLTELPQVTLTPGEMPSARPRVSSAEETMKILNHKDTLSDEQEH